MSDSAKTVIYTALFGGQTTLKEPLSPELGKFVCFTDDPAALKTKSWEIVPCRRIADPRMNAKWYRTASDYLFPEYDVSIWIDASMTPDTCALLSAVDKALEGRDIAMFIHPERNNVYEEAAVSATMGKYAGEPLFEQVAAYRTAGLPDAHGLWATGIMARRKSIPIVDFNRLWLSENIRWSWQDQLSVPYVLWKTGIQPGVIPGNIYDTPLASRVWTGPNL